ncbi:hypothetical protein TELCIR_00647 [Teladorsagia circumcincta]|uniref:Uncharacterized protein n=1 Tax=Teladorsagia circumcincta TaxID=45464 RepID=A0A2G9V425_TELCI|nr:hypothetical protein TELCIR_00647 [Teladorsagia circumcincta]
MEMTRHREVLWGKIKKYSGLRLGEMPCTSHDEVERFDLVESAETLSQPSLGRSSCTGDRLRWRCTKIGGTPIIQVFERNTVPQSALQAGEKRKREFVTTPKDSAVH